MADNSTSTSPSMPTPSPISTLPNFHLLYILPEFATAFNTAVTELYPELPEKTQIRIHSCKLQELPSTLRFDAVVSPANSYARLDGAFDDALARVFTGPNDKYEWITQQAQKVLYSKWRGYAPPGTCTVVPLGHVNWDREVVYECIWSLLCAVDEENRKSHGEVDQIKDVLMTPLATGIGRVGARRWAEQCVLAMKYWTESVENPDTWSKLEWEKIFDDHEPIVETYRRET